MTRPKHLSLLVATFFLLLAPVAAQQKKKSTEAKLRRQQPLKKMFRKGAKTHRRQHTPSILCVFALAGDYSISGNSSGKK